MKLKNIVILAAVYALGVLSVGIVRASLHPTEIKCGPWEVMGGEGTKYCDVSGVCRAYQVRTCSRPVHWKPS